MIFHIIFCGIIFFIFGYLFKLSQDCKHFKLQEDFYTKFKNFRVLKCNVNNKFKKKPNLFLIQNKSILINSNINSAIQELFDIILLNYINSWYIGFSNNEDFVVEVKYFFHTICTEILLRVSKVDLTALVTDKFVPAIFNHLHICYSIQPLNNDNINTVTPMQELMLQKMKSHLHVAMIGRIEEVSYLKSVSKFLVPYITPDYISQTENKICFHLLQECLVGTVLLSGMDSLASADFINKVICLILEPSTTSSAISASQSTLVPILHRYQTAWIEKLRTLKGNPKGIECFLRNDRYLYHFLQYIKSINAISPINFFMLMDSITMSLLNPDIDEAATMHLYQDLQRLENLMENADEYSDLNVSSTFHERVKEILADGHKNIVQLINCEIWMENYNSICQHTQSLYLAQYFESEYYLATIYGEKQSDIDLSYECEWENINVIGECFNVVNTDDANDGKGPPNEAHPPNNYSSFKRLSLELFSFDFNSDHKSPVMEEPASPFSTYDKLNTSTLPFFQSIFQKEKEYLVIEKPKDFSMINIGTSIKNALSFNNDDSVYTSSCDTDGNNDYYSESIWTDKVGSFIDFPDLSNLRVKIPSISQPYIGNKAKIDFCFSIHTYKIDSDELLFKVHRKYMEFYILEQKLIEFHGNIGRNLPTKRPWDNKKLDFLDNCKYEFETYLLFLLNRSFLKNSQLLYTFLTSASEFNNNTLIDINLGRFVKAMPMKLAKEKGQFLEHFLSNFHVSCESAAASKSGASSSDPNPSSTNTVPETQISSITEKRMHSRMFWNNAEFINVNAEQFMNEPCSFSTCHIFYFYDAICYLCQMVTKTMGYSHIALSVLYRLRTVCIDLLQRYIVNIIRKGIEKICSEKLAIEIIHNLRDAALLSGNVRTYEEKLERRNQALSCFHQILPDLLMAFLPKIYKENLFVYSDRIFDCLQQPKLNKQLSYVLFDILLVELFPELTEDLVHIKDEILTNK